jgi:hypothetical protein
MFARWKACDANCAANHQKNTLHHVGRPAMCNHALTLVEMNGNIWHVAMSQLHFCSASLKAELKQMSRDGGNLIP